MRLEEISLLYSQEADTCDPSDLQELKVFTQDGGGGPFLILQTARWALGLEDLKSFFWVLRKILTEATKAWEKAEAECSLNMSRGS